MINSLLNNEEENTTDINKVEKKLTLDSQKQNCNRYDVLDESNNKSLQVLFFTKNDPFSHLGPTYFLAY